MLSYNDCSKQATTTTMLPQRLVESVYVHAAVLNRLAEVMFGISAAPVCAACDNQTQFQSCLMPVNTTMTVCDRSQETESAYPSNLQRSSPDGLHNPYCSTPLREKRDTKVFILSAA